MNELYELKKEDITKAQDVLTDAFAQDPFIEYILDDRKDDVATARRFHKFTIKIGFKYGKIYAPTNKIEGVIIWLTPKYTQITTWQSIRLGILKIWDIRGDLGKRNEFLKRMKIYSDYSMDIHKKHMIVPHWYLFAIGIRKEYRGKGYASKLINPMLTEMDEDNMPCYLETHNPINVSIYKHFGFEVVEEGKIPRTNRTHWAMLRKN